jgi:ubiquinol-cytochrome c reductase cytochrome b subunit
LLFALPWLDTSKVRSAKFRPTYRIFFWILVVDLVILTYVGGQKPEGIFPIMGLVGTAYYFAHFLVIMPYLGFKEKTLPLPESIANPVVKAAE